ncbi:hypothetical protein [Breoghania sp.]|uniref:hypothetical protein n=1 Tax=Breoghania sp. TaxID=2065378 RepID=UPI002AA6768A|nr:hypothetical protein [Breoghania sp.]
MTEEQEQDELARALRDVLSMPSGKRLLFWVLGECNLYGDPFSSDGHVTDYLLGKQAIGRKIIDLMNSVDLRAYPTLLLDVADIKAMEEAAEGEDAGEEDNEI